MCLTQPLPSSSRTLSPKHYESVEKFHFLILHPSCYTHFPQSPVSLIEKRKYQSSVMSDSLRPHGLQPTKLFCPWNSAGKNTGVDSHSLLQGIFLTQGSSPGLLQQMFCERRLAMLQRCFSVKGPIFLIKENNLTLYLKILYLVSFSETPVECMSSTPLMSSIPLNFSVSFVIYFMLIFVSA